MKSVDGLFGGSETYVFSFRSKVEAKKTELRELVGDHYRSVLESSDHIRAMSECGLEGIQSLDWSCSIEFCLDRKSVV